MQYIAHDGILLHRIPCLMLAFEDKIVIKNMLECKRFSTSKSLKNFQKNQTKNSNAVKVTMDRFERTHCMEQLAVFSIHSCFQTTEIVLKIDQERREL